MLRSREEGMGIGMVWLSSKGKRKHECPACYMRILCDNTQGFQECRK